MIISVDIERREQRNVSGLKISDNLIPHSSVSHVYDGVYLYGIGMPAGYETLNNVYRIDCIATFLEFCNQFFRNAHLSGQYYLRGIRIPFPFLFQKFFECVDRWKLQVIFLRRIIHKGRRREHGVSGCVGKQFFAIDEFPYVFQHIAVIASAPRHILFQKLGINRVCRKDIVLRVCHRKTIYGSSFICGISQLVSLLICYSQSHSVEKYHVVIRCLVEPVNVKFFKFYE